MRENEERITKETIHQNKEERLAKNHERERDQQILSMEHDIDLQKVRTRAKEAAIPHAHCRRRESTPNDDDDERTYNPRPPPTPLIKSNDAFKRNGILTLLLPAAQQQSWLSDYVVWCRHANFHLLRPGELKQVTGNKLEAELRSGFEEVATDTNTAEALSAHIQAIFDKLNPVFNKRFVYVNYKWPTNQSGSQFLIQEAGRAKLAQMAAVTGEEFRILMVMSKIPDPVARKEVLELDNPTLLDIRNIFDNLERVKIMNDKFTSTPISSIQQRYNCFNSEVNEVRGRYEGGDRGRERRSQDRGTQGPVQCYRCG
jgi:hypothetical protein